MDANSVALLTKPFKFNDHEFMPRGFAYLAEAAITTRLDQVDPAWSWEIKNVQNRTSGAITTVTVIGKLTVLGVSRDGVGSDIVELDKAGERPVNEAEKAAATDALRRAARLFGVGRYLLGAPRVRSDDERSKTAFFKWLDELNYEGDRLKPEAVWTREEQAAWWQKHTAAGLSRDFLLRALGVNRLSEFKGRLEDAELLVNQALGEQQVQQEILKLSRIDF